ncbi:MAG: HD domain-containing protein [Halobacteriaceae archaeon]
MRAIKDSVHDYIELSDVAEALLDTPLVQRLRHVKQLSTVRLVYPSANHTRFEHSLGVYHLADRALENLGIRGQDARAVRAAAILHDVGHGPYGHQTEPVIRRRLGRHHDEVGPLLNGGPVASVLADYGLDPARVSRLVAGESELGQLVAGELDVDRMDYLVRDAHHTGVPYGTIDHGRVVRALRVVDGDLALAAGNVPTAESVLVARTLMNATVYRHHVSRIAGTMLERATERLLDAGAVGPDRFARMTDAELLGALRDCPATADTARRLSERDLYKRAIWTPHGEVPDELLGLDHEESRQLERRIAADAGIETPSVHLDVPGAPSMPESAARVVVDDEVVALRDHSPLVEGLRAAQEAQWRLGVYAPPSVLESVADSATRVLGLADTARP